MVLALGSGHKKSRGSGPKCALVPVVLLSKYGSEMVPLGTYLVPIWCLLSMEPWFLIIIVMVPMVPVVPMVPQLGSFRWFFWPGSWVLGAAWFLVPLGSGAAGAKSPLVPKSP